MKKPRPPSLVTVATMTTITTVFWVFFSVYRVLTTKVPTNVPPDVLEPISANLDSEALAQIDKRVYFEKGEVEQFATQITPIIELEETGSTSSSGLEVNFQEEIETATTEAESVATESGDL